MPSDLVFREKIVETPEPVQEAPKPVELKSDDVTGATKASEESDEPKERRNALDDWETSNGVKYGVELFGLKEVIREFPYGMQFGAIDNYIREEIGERGLEPSPKVYQDILAELEGETGTEDVETFTKLKKLSEYLKVVKKFKEIKKKKEAFRF